MRVATAGAFALVLALLLVGCGGSGHLDGRGATLLDAQIGAARQAAARGDIVRAGALVQAAEDTVNSLRARHWIDDRRAASILAAIGDTQDALRAYAATSTTTTTVAQPPPAAGPAPSPKRHGHHKGEDD